MNIKKNIKKTLEKNRVIKKILIHLRFIKMSTLIDKNKSHLPIILQFPITNTCNSKCVMCNVTSNILGDEMTDIEFSRIINDPLFNDLKIVGINGGEPFLSKNLIHYVTILTNKKSITDINIITNGFLTSIIKDKLPIIYQICQKKDKRLHISLSLDGVNDIHDKVRVIPGAFNKTMETVRYVKTNSKMLCDSYDVGCTVVRQNVDYLMELYDFALKENLPIKFRLGIDNERLYNKTMHDDFSVLSDINSRQTATEFFYFLFTQAIDVFDKYKFWSIYSYLEGNEHRYLGCEWQSDNGITMDGEGTIYYCAVQSPAIGNLRTNKGMDIFFKKENQKIRNCIRSKNCDKCIHDYFGSPKFKNVIRFYKFLLKKRLWVKLYK